MLTPPQNDSAGLADPLIQRGLAASAEGRSLDAIAIWDQASKQMPGAAMPHFLIGSEYAAMGKPGPAETSLANAVLLAPGFLMARYQLGFLLLTSQRLALALVVWEPLLLQQSRDPLAPALAQFVRGHAAMAQGQWQQAVDCFNAGLRLNTTNLPLSNDIAAILKKVQLQLQAPAGGQAPESSDDASLWWVNSLSDKLKPH